MRGRFERTMAAGILLVVTASGCSAQSHPAPTTSITVYASSAMIKSLTAIGKQFEAENPGTSVEFIFAGSSDLAAELANGNGADVFVSGDHENMAAWRGPADCWYAGQALNRDGPRHPDDVSHNETACGLA